MLRLNLVSVLEAMKEAREDFEEGQNHLARHIPHMRLLNGLQARKGGYFIATGGKHSFWLRRFRVNLGV